MKLSGLILLLFAHLTSVSGQPITKKYVQQNSVPIATISPDSLDFSDFLPVQKAIGNARVVMLGEQDHGDAPTFSAKSRLINFLYKNMGFEVLAFEGDFFALNYGFDNQLDIFKQNPLVLDSFLIKNVYGIWTYCDACKPLFNNILPNTYTKSRPLLISGFDNQMNSSYSSKYLIAKLDSVLRSNDLPITKMPDYLSVILPQIDSLRFRLSWQKDPSVFNTCATYLNELKYEMTSKFEKNDFWMMLVSNLIMENEEYRNLYNKKMEFKSKNTRDYQMALNLYWLCNVKYPNKKIIVWAHNYHISKFSGHYSYKPLDNERSMGSVFAENLKMQEQTYVLGFTSYKGVAGRLGGKQYTLDTPSLESFETWLPSTWDYGFVDFLKLNKIEPTINEMFYMSGSPDMFIHKTYKALWTKIFDGVFYIKDMYPCKSTVKFSDPKKD